MGGTGFPTLMFMTADGKRLMKHSGERSAEGFDVTLADAQAFIDLAREARTGNGKHLVEVTIRQLQLEWFDLAEAKERVAALGELPDEQKKLVEQLLIDTEVRCITNDANGKDAEVLKAGEHFRAMWNENRIPSAPAMLHKFWFTIAVYADQQGDKPLFTQVITAYKGTLRNSNYRRNIKHLEDRLERFGK